MLAVTTQRKSAEQIRASLWAQLGLSVNDFFNGPTNYEFATPTLNSLGEDNCPVWGADEPNWVMQTQPAMRHAALGWRPVARGPAARPVPVAALRAGARPDSSQAWCKMAIAKSNNQLLFPFVDPSAPSAANAAAIKQNIGYLALHFLGDPASPDDVDGF